MNTYALTLSYDGTDFHGWQRQNGVRTVQEEVENALSRLVSAPVAVTASGRTDEGVHALGQVVSFCCDSSVPPQNMPAALNAYLPRDITAVSCVAAPEGFCARRSAKRKTYVYRIYVSQTADALFSRFALRVPQKLDLPLLKKAAAAIVGERDFRSFYCLGSSSVTTVRTVYKCEFNYIEGRGIVPDGYEFEICGNGFLYKTVRLLVSALLRLDCGKLCLDDFTAALDGKIALRKIPSPPNGLTLKSVEY